MSRHFLFHTGIQNLTMISQFLYKEINNADQAIHQTSMPQLWPTIPALKVDVAPEKSTQSCEAVGKF